MSDAPNQQHKPAVVGLCIALAAMVAAVTVYQLSRTDSDGAGGLAQTRDSSSVRVADGPDAAPLSSLPAHDAGERRADTEPQAQDQDASAPTPEMMAVQGQTGSSSDDLAKQVLAEFEKEYAATRSTLNELTSHVYNDLFRRGHSQTIPAGESLPGISGKLVSIRYHQDGSMELVEIPREGFDYEYSLKKQVDEMTLDLIALRQAVLEGE